MAASGEHDQNALTEAREFLQDQWHSLGHNASRARKRVKSALDNVWKQLVRKK